LSPDTSSSQPVVVPRSSHRLPCVCLFLLAASTFIAIAGLSLSCTWQEQMEQTLALGINQIRADVGLPPLTNDPQLSAIARYRAQVMAVNDYFSHYPPDGCATRCLMEREGLMPAWVGEVIAWDNGRADESADVTISGWRDSPAHYAVITNGCFTRMGTGTVTALDGRIYDVVVFEGRAPGC